jgi:hypothetical protein
MAIKKLQHGFTNPTQSKMLLKLGIPVDSADCAYRGPHMPITVLSPNELYSDHEKEIHDLESKRDRREGRFQICEPCWTVGCLMEIFDTCYTEADADEKWENHNALHKGQTYVDYIMYVFDHNYMLGKLDFSKLEE